MQVEPLPFVDTLQHGTAALKARVVTALWKMSESPANRAAIAIVSGIPVLIIFLREGEAAYKAVAMGSLRNLATISDDRKDIEHAIGSQNKALSTNSRLSIDGRLRAVQASLHPLLLKIGFGDTSKCRYPTVVESAQFLELVRHGNYSHIVNAVRALMNLLRRKPESKSAIVAARVIPQLFAVVRAGNGAQVVSAAKARSKLTDNDDTAKIISDEGDMAILVDLLGYDDDCGKEQAVLSLLDTAGKRKTEADVGGVPLLVALVGTPVRDSLQLGL